VVFRDKFVNALDNDRHFVGGRSEHVGIEIIECRKEANQINANSQDATSWRTGDAKNDIFDPATAIPDPRFGGVGQWGVWKLKLLV
jgi:hypothetical protein